MGEIRRSEEDNKELDLTGLTDEELQTESDRRGDAGDQKGQFDVSLEFVRRKKEGKKEK